MRLIKSKENDFEKGPTGLLQKKIFFEKEMLKPDEELESVIQEDFNLITPSERYKKYLNLLENDPRIWKRSYHVTHLFCDFLMVGIGLKFVFRAIRLKNRRFENYSNFLPKLNQISSYSWVFLFTNMFTLFYIYLFSRYYLYEVAYDVQYNYKLISNKDFLDMCDTIELKNHLRKLNNI